MLRALEIFWLSLTVFCLLAALYAFYAMGWKDGVLLILAGGLGVCKYYIRRKQRIAHGKKHLQD